MRINARAKGSSPVTSPRGGGLASRALLRRAAVLQSEAGSPGQVWPLRVRAVQRRNSRHARAAVGRRGPNFSSECAAGSPPLRCCASDTAMTQTVSPPWLQLVLFYFFKSVALWFSLSFHSAVLLYVRCHWLGRPRRVTSRGSFYLCDGKMIERDCGTCMCVSCERADGWSGGYRFSHVRAPAPFVPRPTLCFTFLARLSVPTDFFEIITAW